MFQQPFKGLAIFLIATILCPICLPLAVLVGYPALLMVGVACLVRWRQGELKTPAQAVSLCAMYLGFVMILHGVVVCTDTPLAGSPPSAEEKRFGTGLAYLGAAIAGGSAIAAYWFSPPRPLAKGVSPEKNVDDF